MTLVSPPVVASPGLLYTILRIGIYSDRRDRCGRDRGRDRDRDLSPCFLVGDEEQNVRPDGWSWWVELVAVSDSVSASEKERRISSSSIDRADQACMYMY
jgi:hypothetical protein